jgi:hypothetical protein
MSRRIKGRINGPFVPVLKDTIKTHAWKALSHGARSLYVALKSRYNSKTQNAVWLSTRDAEDELGSRSDRRYVLRWFRELRYYGFIVMVSPAHHGVNGHGKAPHWRLTEEWYLGEAPPTRDFLRWDGEPFQEQKRANFYQPKNRIRGDYVPTTLVTTCLPPQPQKEPETVPSGDNVPSISGQDTGDNVPAITSKPLASATDSSFPSQRGLNVVIPDDLGIPLFLRRVRPFGMLDEFYLLAHLSHSQVD